MYTSKIILQLQHCSITPTSEENIVFQHEIKNQQLKKLFICSEYQTQCTSKASTFFWLQSSFLTLLKIV